MDQNERLCSSIGQANGNVAVSQSIHATSADHRPPTRTSYQQLPGCIRVAMRTLRARRS